MAALPGGFPLTIKQISEDLVTLEEDGTDTSVLSDLVKDFESSVFSHQSPNEMMEMSDLIARLSKLNPDQMQAELNRTLADTQEKERGLHETVYESSMLFVKISEWMNKTRTDFEDMLGKLQTIQEAQDAAIFIANGGTTPP